MFYHIWTHRVLSEAKKIAPYAIISISHSQDVQISHHERVLTPASEMASELLFEQLVLLGKL